MYGMILAYNTKAFASGKEPKSWKDYWNIEGFSRAPGDARWATLCPRRGVTCRRDPKDKLYPLDVEQAFGSLDKIKGNVTCGGSNGPRRRNCSARRKSR